MPLATQYRTERLALRPGAASDEAAVVSAIDDLGVSRWLAVVPHPYRSEDFLHFLDNIAVLGETFLIEDRSGFSGIISLVDEVLGYWLDPKIHGRDCAT